MYRLEREEFVQLPYISLWSTLGFQAGYINAFGFLACGRYVSHVTGFGTQIGVGLANGQLDFAVELLGFPLSFILGSFTNGVLTSARMERGLRPRFDVTTLALPLLLAILIWFGQEGLFGPFGEQLVSQRDFILLFLLSFLCGMQNGCFAVLTKGQIRTTHLTGISTDIGTDLARTLFGRLSSQEAILTRRTNLSRIATFVAFASGSIVSVLASRQWGYQALTVPLGTSIGVFLAVRWISNRINAKRSAVTGETRSSP